MFGRLEIVQKLNKVFFFKKKEKKNLILLEFYNYYPSLIGFGYFLQVLTKIKNAKVICYHQQLNNILVRKCKKLYVNFSIIGKLFRAIGVSKFIFIKRIIINKIIDITALNVDGAAPLQQVTEPLDVENFSNFVELIGRLIFLLVLLDIFSRPELFFAIVFY